MKTEGLDEGLYRTTTENGLTVLSEAIGGVRSVATGIWVKTASVHETPSKMGVSHLLEHMVFKGTKKRSARDIALELETRGGALDAYTSRDHTSFQARVLDEDLPRAVDVLTDLVRRPSLDQSDLELERKVVLEEISTVEDTPDDLVFDIHSRTLWPDHPYGFSILGTRDTVSELDSADLRELHDRGYHPSQIVIAAAGSVNHDVFLKLLAKEGWFASGRGPDPMDVTPVPDACRRTVKVARDTAQTHTVIGTDTFGYGDRRRYPLMLINTVLGSGMSSRLFQRVREEMGLAYAIYSFQSFYRGSGITGVYVGTHPESADEAIETIRTELERVASQGLPQRELAGAKQQLKGQITLGLESPSARMYRLAALALYGEPYRNLDRTLSEIDAVSAEQVHEVAREFFQADRQTVVSLGPG